MSFRKFTFILTLILAFWSLNFGQTVGKEPRQEKLLNGLKVLMWSDPASPKVSVRLRIHAGASFDPQNKDGVMKLLSESIFPNDDVREFFTDELGGDLKVTCNYDFIEIAASSKADSYLSLLETLANAVTNPVFDKAVTNAVKAKVSALVDAEEKNAAYQADLAVRKRLFQAFPYGRPINGSSASLKTIDFADLKLAYDRLFGADNATLTISGNFPPDVGFRAARRYFGSWLKSDKRIPSTFRQPDAPAAGTQIISAPGLDISEIRYAIRGVARNDKDYAASVILARILEQRIRAKAPEDKRSEVFIVNDANILPGVVIVGFTGIKRPLTAEVSGERPKVEANDAIALALSEKITAGEFDQAKAAATADFAKRDEPTRWLDADTFRLASLKSDQLAFASVTLADAQALAERFKQQPVASVLALAGHPRN